MGRLFGDALQIALGVGVEFSFAFWLIVTVMLVIVGPLIVQVSPKVIDPPGRLIATRPERVALWLPLSLAMTAGLVVFLFVTIVGAPLALFIPLLGIFVSGAGYLALARIVGERVLAVQRTGRSVPPGVSALVGIVLFRLVRLIPFVGAFAHSMICWIGYAATCAVLWSVARSWHRRRMPDSSQFAGETLVEWYPDGDPADGKPAIGTGRPVLGNLRGEEDDSAYRKARRGEIDADET